MARRRTDDDATGINLDSLMDALTNVVAVLILVLLLVQADVSKKIADFTEGLEPATREQVDQARAELESLKAQMDTKNRQLTGQPPTPEELERAKLELAKLNENLLENKDLLTDLDKLRELEKKLRIERDQAKQATHLVQEEIAKLEAMLDTTPVLAAPPPEEVSIPNSRPIPSNAEIYYALVFGNRVHLIDPFTPVKLFQTEFNKRKNDFRIERVAQKGADLYIHDQTKIVEHFSKFDFRAPHGQTISVLPNQYGTQLPLRILPDPVKGGTPLEELRKPGSEFEKAVRVLSNNRRAVVMFWVTPESFNTYLLARKVTDNAKVPAGWEVNPGQAYHLILPDLIVKPLAEPPPPPPDQPVSPPPPPAPPPLQPKLD